MSHGALCDAELVRAASAGDASSLGLLLERHRATMRAAAVGQLGFGADADDAVQEAMVIALRHLQDLRDPDAVGAWLRAVVRNVCRMQRRRARPPAPIDPARVMATADERLDRHALRDWVWHAVGQLSEPLQLVVLLRHFGEPRSYADIAEICGVPVGTVRSRLHEARRQLAGLLLAAADAVHDDVHARTRRRQDRLEEVLHTTDDAGLADAVADLTDPGMVMAGWWGAVGGSHPVLTAAGAALAADQRTAPDGRQLLMHVLAADATAGVRERVLDVAASERFTVMECELINPPWDPTHCPPAVLWVIAMRDERVQGIRLHHPV